MKQKAELKMVAVSYDEKPGIQILKNMTQVLPPIQENGTVGRIMSTKRLGKLSLFAVMDLLTGEIIPLVSGTHKNLDFITLF